MITLSTRWNALSIERSAVTGLPRPHRTKQGRPRHRRTDRDAPVDEPPHFKYRFK